MALSLSSNENTSISREETAEILASYLKNIQSVQRRDSVKDIKEREAYRQSGSHINRLLSSAYAAEEIEKSMKTTEKFKKSFPFAVRFKDATDRMFEKDGAVAGYMAGSVIGFSVLGMVAEQALNLPRDTVMGIVSSGAVAAGVVGAVKAVNAYLDKKVDYKDALAYEACREQLAFLKELKKEVKKENAGKDKAQKKGLMASLTSTMKQAGTAAKDQKNIMPAAAMKNLQSQR